MVLQQSRSSGSLPDDLLAARWLEGGRDPAIGLDCLGITLLAAELRGIPVEDPWPRLEAAWQEAGPKLELLDFPPSWRRLDDVRAAQRNDVAVMTVVDFHRRVPGHLGFFWQDRMIVSARAECGVVLEPFERLWRQILGVWRYEP